MKTTWFARHNKEANMVARLTEEAVKPGSKTEQRVEELKTFIGE